MRVAVVNRFFPPDAAITGVSAGDLITELMKRLPTAELRVFATAARYAGGIETHPSNPVRVERIPSLQLQGGKVGRLASSLAEGRALARRAAEWADVVISLTDPPLLGYWIGRELARQDRRVRWLEWTMDLYPEAFCSAGLVGERNPAYRHLLKSVRRYLPGAYLSLGPAQARALAAWRSTDRPIFVLPCGIVEGDADQRAEPPPWRVDEGRTIIVYAGNIGEAHSPTLLQTLVGAADPNACLFVFALYGTHAARIKGELAHCPNIVWTNQLSHAELAHADVHIASLHSAWTHVCVPSKAVSSVCLGRPLLFSGDRHGDTAGLLGDAAWLIDMPPDGVYDDKEIRALLDQICDVRQRDERRRRALRLSEQLASVKQATIDDLAHWVTNGGESGALERAA